MKQKKTGIKIKKSKHNLYNKKKLKTRQTLTVVLTIVAACVLAVVGYGIGKPIVNYFQTRNNSSSDDTSISGSTNPSGSSELSETSPQSGSSDNSSGSEIPPEPVVEDIKLYILPVGATESSASLGSALAAAKEAGFDTVAVTLKDENGYLYYKTDMDKVKRTLLVKGTLTAEQISMRIKKAGMTPAVKISMLKDRVTPMFFGGFTFANGGGWLDNYADAGGKRWLSPFIDETVAYLGDLTEELASSGFEHIICCDVRYPAFHPIDIDSFLNHLPVSDKAKRLEALWNVLDTAKSAAEENNAKLWVEMDGADLVKADKYATDAELAANSGKLADIGVIADYSPNGTESVYENALAFAGRLKSNTGSDVAVLVKRGASGAVPEDISRAFEESELRVFVEN